MKPKAAFPGKFNPPHIGHAATIARLSKDWDLTVVVTGDTPPGAKWSPWQVASAISEIGVNVETIGGKLVDRESNPFPEDVTVLSGNPTVLEWARKLGIKHKHAPRTEGIAASDMREDVEPPADPTDGARRFWTRQTHYPEYGTIKRRRLHELNTLAPMLDGVRSVLDVGCGDGALLRCLAEVTDVEELAGCDYAPTLAAKAPGFFKWDATGDVSLPECEFVTCCGVIPFLFDDADVLRLLRHIKAAAPQAYFRAPCSMGDKPIEVASYSEKLGEDYFSLYRTPEQLRKLINSVFRVVDSGRSYPDEIESEFGTRQFWVRCSRG